MYLSQYDDAVSSAGNEPYSVWEGLRRGSKEYEDLKQERAQTLWKVG